MQLSEQQKEAIGVVSKRIKGAYPEPLTVLAGYAGTGKSTILPYIIDDLGIAPDMVKFLAPTGKAAKVMRSKLAQQNFPNPKTSTIHSAIYRARPAPVGQLESERTSCQMRREELRGLDREGHKEEIDKLTKSITRLDKELKDLYKEDKVHYQLNPDSPIKDAQLLVIDEASMVGEGMRNDLLEFGVPIFAMGDNGQLLPVQEKPGLMAGKPDFELTEVHRQAADNPIIQLATMARKGKRIEVGVYGDGRARVIRRRDFNEQGHFDWDAPAPQFIVGKNDTRWRTTKMLRGGYGFEGDSPQEGEPLIVCKNSRQFPNLINGGAVTSLSNTKFKPGDATFQMSFEDEDGVKYHPKVFQGLFEEHYQGKGAFSCGNSVAFRARKNAVELDWAWALTAHKTQGSQYDHVVVIDESGVFKDQAKNWLYTAVTRAAQTLTILV